MVPLETEAHVIVPISSESHSVSLQANHGQHKSKSSVGEGEGMIAHGYVLIFEKSNSTAPFWTAGFIETFAGKPLSVRLWALTSVTQSSFLQSVFSEEFSWHQTLFLLNFYSYFSLPHNLNLNYMLFRLMLL